VVGSRLPQSGKHSSLACFARLRQSGCQRSARLPQPPDCRSLAQNAALPQTAAVWGWARGTAVWVSRPPRLPQLPDFRSLAKSQTPRCPDCGSLGGRSRQDCRSSVLSLARLPKGTLIPDRTTLAILRLLIHSSSLASGMGSLGGQRSLGACSWRRHSALPGLHTGLLERREHRQTVWQGSAKCTAFVTHNAMSMNATGMESTSLIRPALGLLLWVCVRPVPQPIVDAARAVGSSVVSSSVQPMKRRV